MEASQETEWEVVGDNDDTVSVFPPRTHEGLSIPPPQPTEVDSSTIDDTLGQDASAAESDVADGEVARNGEAVKQLIQLRLEMVRSGVLWVASRVRSCYVVCGSGFWSSATVTTLVVAAVVMYYKVQRRRRRAWKEREQRWMLLLKEKDERIRQQLLQIAEMKEMLLVPRRVPVFRVITHKFLD